MDLPTVIKAQLEQEGVHSLGNKGGCATGPYSTPSTKPLSSLGDVVALPNTNTHKGENDNFTVAHMPPYPSDRSETLPILRQLSLCLMT